eukprot:m.80713 g.80713  ORF g.80713 m.80713 type:complete len:315 (-) comp25342_c0_seq2:614-1558(-)
MTHQIEAVDVGPQDGAVLVGVSKLSGNFWNSELWIFDSLESMGSTRPTAHKSSAAAYSKHCQSQAKWLGARSVVSASDHGNISIWDWKGSGELECTREFKEHQNMVRSLDISPDGSKIISGSQDGSVKLWDVCSDQTFSISTFVGGHHYGVLDAKFHPTTASTFASVGREGSIRMWDTRVQSAPTAVHSLSQPACSFLFTSGMLITGHLDGTVAFYDERNMGLSLQECNTQTNAVNVLRSSATGLVAAGSDDCSVVVYSAKKAKREGATSSDGGLVVHSDSTHSDFVRSVHWTNETKFVTGSWDGQVLEHEVKL